VQERTTLDLGRIFRSQQFGDEEAKLWPRNRLRTFGLRDDLLVRFTSLRNGPLCNDEDAKTIIDILRFFWIRLILSLTYSQSLAEGLFNDGILLDCKDRYPTLFALMTDGSLPDDRFLPMLASGPPRYAKWRWPIRMVRRVAKNSIVRAFPWPEPGRRGEVVTLLEGPLVDQLAVGRNLRPRYCDFDLWFAPTEAQLGKRCGDIADIFLNEGVNAAKKYGVDLRSGTRGWLGQQFELSAARVDAHAQRLQALKSIPSELWIGSSSSYWPRLLAKEVMRREGKVIVFDHGFGSGYFDGVDVPYSMQPFCTEFAVSGGIQAEQIQDFFSSHAIPGMADVVVVPLQTSEKLDQATASKSQQDKKRASRRIKTIMLLPLPLMGELFNLTPYPDDWWVQDLNRRLLADLSALDLKVLVKPHPEFDSSELAKVAASCGAEMIDGRFEETAHLADAFLFTHPLTSTLKYALDNKLPTALIDFGFAPWRPVMKKHLEKYVLMIPGSLGSDDRLHYDGNDLKRWLQRQDVEAVGVDG
jgi:hypothetical protein